ncbi:hypothetical protein AB1Y20_020263 [Prymnesium parvum]|uniref:EF-hand domain-containing protein n=1 Tax=Prymnesium parvum TaxID=97485 RepID=A0AB34JT42_PRYPA
MASPSSSAPPSIPGSGKTRSGEFSARRIWARSRQAIQPENEILASTDSGGSDKFKLKRDGHGSFSTISFEILERIRLGRKSSQKRIDASSTRQSEATSGAPSPESSTCVWPATVQSNSRSSVSVSEQALERSVMRRVRRKQQVGLRKHALMLLDEPNSSNAARTIHVIIPMTIMLSVATAIILSTYIDDEMREVLDSVQTYCHAVFAFELVLRFVVQCQDLITFFEPLFVIDLLSGAVPPIMDIATRSSLLWGGSTLGSHDVIARTLRFFVLLRVLKLVRHYDGARALTKALQRSAPPLLAPLFFTGAGVLLFAGLICLIETEGKAGPDFDTIPEAMWFSVVTLTTLGYGDVVPETAGGRIATALGAVVAVLFMAMPLTIVGNNFAECWNEREALTVVMRLQEFIMLHGLHASDLHAIFEIFDRDGNGWLDMMEFKSVLEFLGLPVPPYKVRKLFRMFDKDGLNQIAVKEFCLSVFPNVHEDVFGFDATNPGSKHSHAERTMAHRALAGCTLAERTAFHGSTWSSSRSLRSTLRTRRQRTKQPTSFEKLLLTMRLRSRASLERPKQQHRHLRTKSARDYLLVTW